MYQQMTLFPKTRHCRNQHSMTFQSPIAMIQMFIKVASSPRLSEIGMPSPILWSHLLKMQRIVLLSSLLWWELGTNSLITGPGEWLSLRRFTSKLFWSWSWLVLGRIVPWNTWKQNLCISEIENSILLSVFMSNSRLFGSMLSIILFDN